MSNAFSWAHMDLRYSLIHECYIAWARVCNRAYHGDIPDMLLKGAILPFPKKGDLSSAPNNRGVTLMVVGAKIFNRMLLDRFLLHIDPKLRNSQNGFRKGRSTVSQMHTLRRVVERIKSKNLPAIVTFVDFRKVFDSMNKGKLMEILRAYGVPAEIVDAVNMMNTNPTAQVLSPEGDAEFGEHWLEFSTETIWRHLFIIALDYAMRQAIGNERNLIHSRQVVKQATPGQGNL